jgi:hypothetical protein
MTTRPRDPARTNAGKPPAVHGCPRTPAGRVCRQPEHALLREWNFDVLSTAPEMSAMLKAEWERVMIAQVTHSGAVRVSMPWLWTGSGRPVLVAGIGNSAGRS